MQAEKKVLEGYMEYFKRNSDPNFRKAFDLYGENAVYKALEMWTGDKNIEGSFDPADIPVKEIIRMLSEEKYKLISHP